MSKEISEIVPVYQNAFRVNWMPIRRCNYDCSYCFPGAHDNFSAIPDVNHLIDRARFLISEIRASNDIFNVDFTFGGGEVFLIKNVDLLFESIANMGCTSSVVTNMSATTGLYMRSIPHLRTLTGSWHFESDKDAHNMKVIKALAPVCKHLNICIMDHPEYTERVKAAKEFCEEVGVKHRLDVIYDNDNIPIKEYYK